MSQPKPNPKPSAQRASQPRTRSADKPQPDRPWLWNVVLLDDQEHSDLYVIAMMQEIFALSPERGEQIARAVDGDGRAIVMTTHKEHAELKRDQILAYGKDPQVKGSRGSMKAVIEPAEQPEP